MTAPTDKSTARLKIVVAYAHTAAGAAALRWAALEGERLGRGLEVVHVFDVDRRADAGLGADREEARRDTARRAQHRVRDVVEDSCADVPVSFHCAEGALQDALAAAANGCSCLVLGEPGDHGDTMLPALLEKRCGVPVTVVSDSGQPRQVVPELR